MVHFYSQAQIEEFLKKEKSVAALRIQTLWRGHRERTRLTERQKVAQQVHSAIVIQRAVRIIYNTSIMPSCKRKNSPHRKVKAAYDVTFINILFFIENYSGICKL